MIRPTAQAARIDVSEAPIIDGDLSDPVWVKATIIDKFTQKQPNPGTEPTKRTVVRIMYDANNLYVGVYNYDSQPDAIVVRSMQRDGPLYTSDSFVLQLDPGQTRRNAYGFEVGASGGRTDELELQYHARADPVEHDLRGTRSPRRRWLDGGGRHSISGPFL